MRSNPIPEPWHSFFVDIDKSLKEELALHFGMGRAQTIGGAQRSQGGVL
jgi:hypothetical protein